MLVTSLLFASLVAQSVCTKVHEARHKM